MADPARRRGNRFRVHWTEDAIIDAIQRWHELHGEAPRRTDWDATRCEKLSQAAREKADEWRQRATLFRIGEWPSARTVSEVFGTWNEAINKAGFTPRLPSQRTARGTGASHFLTPLGHVVSGAYEAEDTGDIESLRVALLQVAEVASQLAAQLDSSEAAIAAAMSPEVP